MTLMQGLTIGNFGDMVHAIHFSSTGIVTVLHSINWAELVASFC